MRGSSTKVAVAESAPPAEASPKVEEMGATPTLTTEEPIKEENKYVEGKETGEKVSDATATVDDSTADDRAIALALSEGYDLSLPKNQKTNPPSTTSVPPIGQDEILNNIPAKKTKKKTQTFRGNPKDIIDDIVAKSEMTPASASEAKEWLVEVSNSIRNLGSEHCACADLLLMYARTQRWFTFEKFIGFLSPPVQLREHDPGSQQTASKISAHVKNTLVKKYQAHYPWGQMCSWFKQTIYDPTASLSAERRGTMSLPDVESAYNNGAYMRTDRKQLFRILRENASRNWPTTMQWSFKNHAKMYGSPWFDDALRETRADFAALKGGRQQDMSVRETKKQTIEFLDELEKLTSSGTTSVGFAKNVGKKLGKSAGITKRKKQSPKQPGRPKTSDRKRSLNHLYAKGPDGKAFKCGHCKTCINKKLKKRCLNTPLLDNVDVSDVKVEDLAPGAVVYGTTMESLMTLRCVKCQSGDDEERMLICDGCDESIHTYCAGLDEIPSCEHWFCDGCAGGPKEKAFYERKRTAILQTKGLLPIPKNPKATTVTTTTAEPTTKPISPSHNNTTSSDGAIVVAKPPGAD